MRSLFRLLSLSAVLTLLLASVAPAFAATVDEVVDAVADDGVYIESGASISDAEATAIVSSARAEGSRFTLVVLSDTPSGGAIPFAEAVLDRLPEGTVLVLTPNDAGWATEEAIWSDADLETAYQFANDRGGDDGQYAESFVESLTGATIAASNSPGSATTSGSTGAAQPSTSGSSGGGSALVWLIVIVGGLALFVWWMVRRSRRQQGFRTENEFAKARTEIQLQIDAVANDILEMEDEVRVADNNQVDALYESAGETYRTASEELATADSPAELLEITNELDVAIWQLDSAEALLDGKQAPPRPEPKRLEPVTAPTPSGPTTTGGPLGVPPRPSFPPSGGYTRRSTRRSGGVAPSLIEMLIRMGGAGLGARAATRSRSTTRASSRSSGSGGGFLPSPSRSGSRSSSRRSSSRRRSGTTSRRRGGGGRRR